MRPRLNQTGRSIEAIALSWRFPDYQPGISFLNWYNARIARCGALIHDLRDGCPENPLPSVDHGRVVSRVTADQWLRQSIPVDSLDDHFTVADSCAREGVCEPRAVGFLERNLEPSGQ